MLLPRLWSVRADCMVVNSLYVLRGLRENEFLLDGMWLGMCPGGLLVFGGTWWDFLRLHRSGSWFHLGRRYALIWPLDAAGVGGFGIAFAPLFY